MTERLRFQAEDQGEIAKAAGEIYYEIKDSLPRVSWFSNSATQDAFRDTVRLVTESASHLDADDNARKAVIFWTLTILYANKVSFRLATASIKNWGAYGITPIASTFVSWIGEDTHPNLVIAAHIEIGAWEEA